MDSVDSKPFICHDCLGWVSGDGSSIPRGVAKYESGIPAKIACLVKVACSGRVPVRCVETTLESTF